MSRSSHTNREKHPPRPCSAPHRTQSPAPIGVPVIPLLSSDSPTIAQRCADHANPPSHHVSSPPPGVSSTPITLAPKLAIREEPRVEILASIDLTGIRQQTTRFDTVRRIRETVHTLARAGLAAPLVVTLAVTSVACTRKASTGSTDTSAQAAQNATSPSASSGDSNSQAAEGPNTAEPFRGDSELSAILASFHTVGDYVKNAPAGLDYSFYIDGMYGDIKLYATTGSGDDKTYLATFGIETNSFINEETWDPSRQPEFFRTLPQPVLSANVKRGPDSIDFERMGIPWSIRGIRKGSSVEDLKRAFFDTRKHETKACADDCLTEQYLYTIEDIYPDIQTPGYVFAVDRRFDHPRRRLVIYNHTIPQTNDEGSPTFNSYCLQTTATFEIGPVGAAGADGVIGFSFSTYAHEG